MTLFKKLMTFTGWDEFHEPRYFHITTIHLQDTSVYSWLHLHHWFKPSSNKGVKMSIYHTLHFYLLTCQTSIF